jgi:cytochrome c553
LLSKQALCGTCHLPNYVGREQMPRLAGQREDYLLHSMRQFRNNTATGRDTIMAASLHGMNDDDLKAIAHYLALTK